MPQSTGFPLRYGLSLPPAENLKSIEVFSEGGLDLTQSIIENRPGCASKLINFEPSFTGGYRRISGYAKYSSTIVPGTGVILGVAVARPGEIIAARQDALDGTKYNLYKSTGTSWTQLNPAASTLSSVTHTSTTLDVVTTGLVPGQPITGTDIPANTYIISITDSSHLEMSAAATGSTTNNRTFANPLAFSANMFITTCFYNWSGPVRTAFFDGVNYPYRWDATTGFTMLVGTAAQPAPKGPQWGTEFQGYLMVAGYPTNAGAMAWCAPNNDNDWDPADGAAEVVVGDVVTGLKVWRNQVTVFCNSMIKKLIPNTLNTTGISAPPPFQIQPITDRLGCPAGRSIKECDGDILFLAPDGVRTISGTINIGDTEIATISRPIQEIVLGINYITTPPMAVTIHKKTQYRLFYPDYTLMASGSKGILGGIRRFRDGHEGWEWAQLIGFQPTCLDSGYLNDGQEYVVHGGPDGYIYRQEEGNTLNGNPVNEVYTTVPLELGDIGIRKALHRITVYVTTETGANDLNLSLIYNYNNPGIINPPTYILRNVGNTAFTYDSGVTYDSGIEYGVITNTSVRQLVQGSGFIVMIQMNNTSPAAGASPYVIQGYYVEFFPGGRR